ncbi:MAG: methyltransferase domain-containing protein [Comamonadaceae bacterium]|nr:methyltransferase domain-containing protein [Comamonadaceae bacterium]
MANGERVIKFATREGVRRASIQEGLDQELDFVAFADVETAYFERANHVAEPRSVEPGFLRAVSCRPIEVVCWPAGAGRVRRHRIAVGIALLRKQPDLVVHAIDRSEAMQAVGRRAGGAARPAVSRASIGDAHQLPFPDSHFDVVTLRYASRRLRIPSRSSRRKSGVCIKPGGHFHHGDMLRPGQQGGGTSCTTKPPRAPPVTFTAVVFRSGNAARNCRRLLHQHPAPVLLRPASCRGCCKTRAGFREVAGKALLGGMVGFRTRAPRRRRTPAPGGVRGRAGACCARWTAQMMRAYLRQPHRRAALARHSLFGLLLPAVPVRFLDINVRKEIEEGPARARGRGDGAAAPAARPTPADATAPADTRRATSTRRSCARPRPVPVNHAAFRCGDIGPARRQRIERLLDLSHRLLGVRGRWLQQLPGRRPRQAYHPRHSSMRRSARYCASTRPEDLQNARRPACASRELFTLARDATGGARICSVMETAAEELAGECTGRIYQPRS